MAVFSFGEKILCQGGYPADCSCSVFLSPLFTSKIFAIRNLKQLALQKCLMLHNILLRISLESLKRNTLLSLSCIQSQETTGWWRVVSNTLMSFCWLCKNMLPSEPLLTPARRSYRRKWSTLACSSWTAGRSAGTWHVYLSKLWRSPVVWVFFLLQLTLRVFSLITLSPPPTPPFFKESDLLSEDP